MSISLIRILKSNYCKVVLVLSLVLVYFITPKKIFYGYYALVGVIFILITSLLITCFIRNVKEKALSAKRSGASFFGIVLAVLGLGALQACTIGAPVCGASIGAGFLTLVFPGVAMNFLEEYSLLVVSISLVFQVFALYLMGCLKIKKCVVNDESSNSGRGKVC